MRATRVLAALLVLALVGPAGTYTVRLGDTLGAIAARHRVTVTALVKANHLANPDLVLAGQVLTISGGTTPAPAARLTVHRVAGGETLGGIAARSHVPLARLVRLNGIRNPDFVAVGVLLRLEAAPTWVCPVQGKVTFVSGFGDPRPDGLLHQGVDLAAPRATPVVANVAGTLEHHPNPRGGLAYILRGDDGDFYYGAHLEGYVGGDGRVRLGQAIGRVGNTGDAAGGITHLHFERWAKGGAPVDPLPLLATACPTS